MVGQKVNPIFLCLRHPTVSAKASTVYIIVNLASGVAYVGGQTGEGREHAAGADGRRALTGSELG